MAVIDFKDSEVIIRDPGNKDIVGKTRSRTIQLGMFGTSRNAIWAGDRRLKVDAYPVGRGSFHANRKAFRLEPGDPFILNYEPYGISNKVWRVLRIEEESAESEKIVVHCVEDVSYLSTAPDVQGVKGSAGDRTTALQALAEVKVEEAPYVVVGDEIRLMTLAGRRLLREIGYKVLISVDGSSYNQLALCEHFSVHGTLVSDYTDDTFEIDSEVGFQVDFDNDDVDQIESISESEMLMGRNFALLGTELISFKTITPVSGNRYSITTVVRGMADTVKSYHSAGEEFWYLGFRRFGTFADSQFAKGITRHVKYNPYSSLHTADVSDAEEMSITFRGRAKAPYTPANFKANAGSYHPTYSSDVVLTWDPRLRGTGAGYGDPDTVTDATAVWEGLFKIEVFVGGSKVRTTEGIDAKTWTYTQAMIEADNGGDLPTRIFFRLTNYIDDDAGFRYESGHAELNVYNPDGVDKGAPTTTTTTTTTTTSTSTSSTSTSSSTSSSTTTTAP
ncbi:MAG: hypothetical protein JRI96_07840 [Deltaproteobacteria bacterium]|nr:hypothetical protein [Deltaproteobacteria bacterium]